MTNAVKHWMLDQELARIMIDEAVARQQNNSDVRPLLDHDISRLASMRVSPHTANPNHALVVVLGIASVALVHVAATSQAAGLPLGRLDYNVLRAPGPQMMRRARTAALVGAVMVEHPQSPQMPHGAADDLHALADSLLEQHAAMVEVEQRLDATGYPSAKHRWEL
jgi:hypothetical protein